MNSSPSLPSAPLARRDLFLPPLGSAPSQRPGSSPSEMRLFPVICPAMGALPPWSDAIGSAPTIGPHRSRRVSHDTHPHLRRGNT